MQVKSYDKLYLDILKIGRKKVGEGLSYNNLKKDLIKKGYDFNNDCIELSVKQWFSDSFCHQGQEDNPYNSILDLDNHLDCNFILKGDPSLRLIEYDTSKRSKRVAILSLAVALFAIGITLFQVVTIKDVELLEKQLELQEEELQILKRFEKEYYTSTNYLDVLKTIQNDSVSSLVSSGKVNKKLCK